MYTYVLKAIHMEPKEAIAYVAKGLALSKLRRWEDAIEAFEKARGKHKHKLVVSVSVHTSI